MKFFKAYVEITNICGLNCSFCPSRVEHPRILQTTNFHHILSELKPFTKEIALHVVGDPLALSNLREYLDISKQLGFRVHITTSGFFMQKFDPYTLLHPAIKQINFSLNSFNKNELTISLEQYLKPILEFCTLKVEKNTNSFINLRLWNQDEFKSEDEFNKTIYQKLNNFFNVEILEDSKSFRVANKVLLNFDEYFEWPDINSKRRSDGYCHAISSQLAVLSNGDVVPCCLDKDGVLKLGNLLQENLKNILDSKRAKEMVEGFKKGLAVEEFCKSCGYKERFKDKNL